MEAVRPRRVHYIRTDRRTLARQTPVRRSRLLLCPQHGRLPKAEGVRDALHLDVEGRRGVDCAVRALPRVDGIAGDDHIGTATTALGIGLRARAFDPAGRDGARDA